MLSVQDRMMLGLAADFLLDDMRREMRRGRVRAGDWAKHLAAINDLEAAKRRLGVVSGAL